LTQKFRRNYLKRGQTDNEATTWEGLVRSGPFRIWAEGMWGVRKIHDLVAFDHLMENGGGPQRKSEEGGVRPSGRKLPAGCRGNRGARERGADSGKLNPDANRRPRIKENLKIPHVNLARNSICEDNSGIVNTVKYREGGAKSRK